MLYLHDSLGLCEIRVAHAGTRRRDNELDQREAAPRLLVCLCLSKDVLASFPSLIINLYENSRRGAKSNSAM